VTIAEQTGKSKREHCKQDSLALQPTGVSAAIPGSEGRTQVELSEETKTLKGDEEWK
jgi:hypothetical protein